jgi:hypothetical protein
VCVCAHARMHAVCVCTRDNTKMKYRFWRCCQNCLFFKHFKFLQQIIEFLIPVYIHSTLLSSTISLFSFICNTQIVPETIL